MKNFLIYMVSLLLAVLFAGIFTGLIITIPAQITLLMIFIIFFLLIFIQIHENKTIKILEKISKIVYFPYKHIIIDNVKDNVYCLKHYDQSYKEVEILFINVCYNKIYVSKNKNFREKIKFLEEEIDREFKEYITKLKNNIV